MMRDAKTAVFVWSMGITQHPHGADGVQMLLNLALTRGWVGRDTCAEEPFFFSNRRAFHRGEPDYGRLLSAIVLEG